MKKLFLITSVIFLLFSCEKEDIIDENINGDKADLVETSLELNTATYTIDGTTYEVSGLTWTEFSNNDYIIDGIGSNNAELSIWIPSIFAGDYNFNDPKLGGDDIDIRITTTNSIFSSVHSEGTIKIIESTEKYVLGEFSGNFGNKTVELPASGNFYIEVK